MSAPRRLALACACALLAGLALGPTAALAASPLQPWIGNPDGWSNLGSFGNVFIDPGTQLGMTFGSRGTEPSPEATMTLPSYPGLTLAPQFDNCESVGPSVRCTGPAGSDLMGGEGLITAAPTTPLGYAGLISVTTPGGGTATIPLWVISQAAGADLEVRTTGANGRAGETVSVTVTVTNHGPSPENWWGINGVHAPGAVLVGQHGCSPGTLSGDPWQCAHTAFTPVGAKVTVTFDFAIVEVNKPGMFGAFSFIQYLNDPWPNNVQIYFPFGPSLGGSPGDGSGGSGTGGSGAGAPPAAAPASVPSPTPTPTDTPTPAGSPSDVGSTPPTAGPAPLASNRTTPPKRWPFVALTGLALLAIFAASGALRLRRRPARVTTVPSPTPDPTPATATATATITVTTTDFDAEPIAD